MAIPKVYMEMWTSLPLHIPFAKINVCVFAKKKETIHNKISAKLISPHIDGALTELVRGKTKPDKTQKLETAFMYR